VRGKFSDWALKDQVIRFENFVTYEKKIQFREVRNLPENSVRTGFPV
jgi:hypothetical protein